MENKNKVRKRVIFVLTCTIFWLVFSVSVLAVTIEELPVISRWENGNGYDEDGNRLEDTWAYDSLHEAGRYVLFGKTGEVLQKAEEWEKKEQVSENFTVTNQNTGTVAIRAKVFEDFAGTVEGSVKEKHGGEYLFELCEANQYSTNLELSPGNYQLSIDAIEKDRRYKVFYDTEEFTLKESELKMENLQVIEECIGTITEEKAIQESENVSQTEQLKTDNVSKEVLEFIGKLSIPLLIISLAGYLFVHRKKQPYT